MWHLLQEEPAGDRPDAAGLQQDRQAQPGAVHAHEHGVHCEARTPAASADQGERLVNKLRVHKQEHARGAARGMPDGG